MLGSYHSVVVVVGGVVGWSWEWRGTAFNLRVSLVARPILTPVTSDKNLPCYSSEMHCI